MARSVRIRNGEIHEVRYERGWFFGGEFVEVTTADDMLFRTRARTPYYRVGDFVLGTELSDHVAGTIFKEFAARFNSELSWGRFVMFLLDLDTIRMVKRIEAVQGSGDSARIVLKSLLKLSDHEFVPLTHITNDRQTLTLSPLELGRSFSDYETYATGTALMTVIGWAVEISMLFVGGAGGRLAASSILEPLMRRAGQRVMRKLLQLGGRRLVVRVMGRVTRKALAFLGKLARDIATAGVREYYAALRSNQLRAATDPSSVRPINMDTIVRTAIRNGVAEHFTSEICGAIEDIVPGGRSSGFLPTSVKDSITRYLTQKLLVAMLSPITALVHASIQAVPVGNTQETYQAALITDMTERLRREVSAESLGGLVSGAFGELVADPSLL